LIGRIGVITDFYSSSMRNPMELLPFWQRLLLTIGVMLVTSYIAGLLCESILGVPIPSYVAGAIGGLAALPIWDFLKRVRPSQASAPD
jgi:hypothetical protein